jgi:hypothetical protein
MPKTANDPKANIQARMTHVMTRSALNAEHGACTATV